MNAQYLDDFCQFAAQTRFESLPADVVQRTKEIIADTLAVIAAGSQESEIVSLVSRLACSNGPGTLIGTGRKTETATAALINGTAGTFLELDEGNQFARGHPAIHIVPAALALAEQEGLSGRDLINSVALGYEIAARIGIACKLRPSMHPHGTWGTVGAALAVGIFASSLTSNQIVAAVVSGGILFALWFLGSAASYLPQSLGNAVGYFSLSNYFPDFARGIIDTRGLIYYLSITVLFLFLATRSLENSRWS